MTPNITQKNVHIFIPYKVAKICSQICKDEKIDVVDAVFKFYQSKTAVLLSDEKSKVWTEGWVGVYSRYRSECGY